MKTIAINGANGIATEDKSENVHEISKFIKEKA